MNSFVHTPIHYSFLDRVQARGLSNKLHTLVKHTPPHHSLSHPTCTLFGPGPAPTAAPALTRRTSDCLWAHHRQLRSSNSSIPAYEYRHEYVLVQSWLLSRLAPPSCLLPLPSINYLPLLPAQSEYVLPTRHLTYHDYSFWYLNSASSH